MEMEMKEYSSRECGHFHLIAKWMAFVLLLTSLPPDNVRDQKGTYHHHLHQLYYRYHLHWQMRTWFFFLHLFLQQQNKEITKRRTSHVQKWISYANIRWWHRQYGIGMPADTIFLCHVCTLSVPYLPLFMHTSWIQFVIRIQRTQHFFLAFRFMKTVCRLYEFHRTHIMRYLTRTNDTFSMFPSPHSIQQSSKIIS